MFLLRAADQAGDDLAPVLWAARGACEASRAATELLRPLAEKHAGSADGRHLADAIGPRADAPPVYQPAVLTFDQQLGTAAQMDLDIEELRDRATTPLPDYDRLTTPDVDRKLMAAAVIWERTNDPAPVVQAVTEAAERLSGRESFIWGYQRASAARTAARLAAAAAPLEAALRTLLDDPIALAAAATALVRAGCDLDVDDVALRLAAQPGQYRNDDTVTALATLAPLLSPATVQCWHELIDQDVRLGTRSFDKTAVAADEQFRAELWFALTGRDRR